VRARACVCKTTGYYVIRNYYYLTADIINLSYRNAEQIYFSKFRSNEKLKGQNFLNLGICNKCPSESLFCLAGSRRDSPKFGNVPNLPGTDCSCSL
jgi:hypothetical protein